jgi:hypothetical protein
MPAGHRPTEPRWTASCSTWRLRVLVEEVDGAPGALQQRDAQVHDALRALLAVQDQAGCGNSRSDCWRHLDQTLLLEVTIQCLSA